MSEASTTPDLVELVRVAFAAFSRGDTETFISYFAPNVVWRSVGLGTSFEGLHAVRLFLEEWRGRYEEYEIEAEEIRDLGNGVLYVKSGNHGRILGSPAHVRLPREVMVHVFVWEEGAVSQVTSSGDTAEARAGAERLADERG